MIEHLENGRKLARVVKVNTRNASVDELTMTIVINATEIGFKTDGVLYAFKKDDLRELLESEDKENGI